MFAIIAANKVGGTMRRNSGSSLLRVGVFIKGSHAKLRLNVMVSAVMRVLAGLAAFGLILPQVRSSFFAFGLISLLTIFTNVKLYGGNPLQNRILGIDLFYITKSFRPSLGSFSRSYKLFRIPS